MTTPLVQLTFALQSFEDPMSAAMSHTMEYEKLSLHADAAHNITLQCVLPDAAHEGDIISLSATHPSARGAQYFTEKVLTNADLESGLVNLTLNHITQSQCFVMQMMLHGKHATLKNSLQFDMHIKAFEQGYCAPLINIERSKPQGIRRYFASMGAMFLSLF
ncbi:hypothetical protein I6F65_06590 [Pseudoalteromonas sp. SWXJZ94C]|uniref:hypothetical protein n=1 Tax=Pseudoalteromonas sp. SWXJZ94C TaxID=2792065 RepID=UPI0018CD30F5|nr:hypothetical protein [Pseudoalteromonas sp. SWXJZ94C]MBH0056623.1 hypothetical protein [Pseudoalteromonas sp. SWXJZ94C]